MRLASDTWRLHWAIPCSVILACGGETSDGSQGQPPTPSGGSPSMGGGSATGGAATAGGYAGCADRVVVYADGTDFPFEPKGINNLPECIPTCSQPWGSIQAIPAGPCAQDSSCVVMLLPDSGAWHYYLCACASNNWECVAVSGAP